MESNCGPPSEDTLKRLAVDKGGFKSDTTLIGRFKDIMPKGSIQEQLK
jgi:hypothetical protein